MEEITCEDFFKKFSENKSIKNLKVILETSSPLKFSDTKIETIEDCIFIGNVSLSESKVKDLKGKIVIDGLLELKKSLLTYLPDDLQAKGIMLGGADGMVTKIGNNVFVEHHFFASHSKIEEIGENLQVGQNLYLINVSIKVPLSCSFGKLFQAQNIPKPDRNQIN